MDSEEQLADSEGHLFHLGLDLVYGGDSAGLVLLEEIRVGQDTVGDLVAGSMVIIPGNSGSERVSEGLVDEEPGLEEGSEGDCGEKKK